MSARKGVIKADEGMKQSRSGFLMLSYPLTNFEIQQIYQIKSKLNGDFSRNNPPKIMDRAYVINFDECKSIKIHWVALHVDGDNITYFNSFGVENISKEIKKFIGNKTVTQNIYRIQACNSIMCGYFCI